MRGVAYPAPSGASRRHTHANTVRGEGYLTTCVECEIPPCALPGPAGGAEALPRRGAGAGHRPVTSLQYRPAAPSSA